MARRFGERRRTYFIKRKFQTKFILKFCALVIIGSVLSGVIVYTMTGTTVTTTFENCRLRIKSTADFILPAVLLSSAAVIIFVGLATVVISLFASHRIAGPLYRIEQDIKEVAAGNLKKKFNLRKSDEIKLLAEGFDKMTQSLRDKVAEVKGRFSELESALEREGRLSEELKEKLQDLKSVLAEFDT